MRPWLLLLVLVAAAGLAMSWAGLPTPWLFGGLAGALAHALARPGASPTLPGSAFRAGQAVVGVVVGSSIEWRRLADLGPRWITVAVVAVFSLVVSVSIGRLLLARGASPVTATFSSIAGGAAGLTAMADDLGADARTVAVLQYLRLLVVLFTMPLVVTVGFGADPVATGRAVASNLPVDLAWTGLAGAVGLAIGGRLRLPSPAIIGPMVVAAATAALPVFADASVPAVIQSAGYVVIGVHVGLKFTVASLRAIGALVPAALLTITVTLVACAGLGWLLVLTTDASPLDAYLATTPGGIYAVMGTSEATGGDVTFVAAAQVLRLSIILAGAPLLAARLRSNEPSP